ncbi:hypothetical protein GGR52DRAFT_532396 [Hypoxylon sp. FL1284]|nr:hypothetical protein GGR52DRAFT_532396 [Hypoxylon sp. FL1284]
MQAHSVIFAAMLAVGAAQPAAVSARADVALESSSKMDPSAILGEMLDLFEKTCHSTCMQLYPEEGPRQENCMTICREHPRTLYAQR